MSKIIMHVDLNYFFVRCEELKDPTLVNKPVMIGGTGRAGIVSTCSYAARKYGVHSGMPSYKAIQLCPNIIVLPGDYHYYHLMSREFFAYVHTYSHFVEPFSVDECYVDMSKAMKGIKDPIGYLKNFQKGLFNKTGLYCSIGVAPTKFLAKMASDMKKPMGLTIIHKKDIEKMIYPLPIDDFFGIGKKSAPRLKEKGINTIGDAAKIVFNDDIQAEALFGNGKEYIKSCLSGNSDDIVNLDYADPKSIGHSTTLMLDTNDMDIIAPHLKEMSLEISEEAKRKNMVGKTIQVVAKDSEFHLHNKSKTLTEPTNDSEKIYSVAYSLYEANLSNIEARLVGVTLQNLSEKGSEAIQMSFDNYEQYEKESEVIMLINKFNRKLNKSVFKRASEVDKKNGNK